MALHPPGRTLSSFFSRLASCTAGWPMGGQGSVTTSTVSQGSDRSATGSTGPPLLATAGTATTRAA